MKKSVKVLGFVAVLAMVASGFAAAMASADITSESDVKSSSVTIYVPDTFTKIQWAVDNATAGDTVIVNSGIYYENVNVTKQLILRGMDTGTGNPVINANGNGSAIILSADGITLERFTALNATEDGAAGINVTSSNCTITGNNISGNNYGIRIYESGDCTVTGNNARDNDYGIYLYYSGNNTVSGNTFVNDGLFVYYSYQNTVEANTVNDKHLVYLEDTSDTEVTDAGQVILVNCTNIRVESQNLSNTCIGVMLWHTEDSLISNNIVCNNSRYGINLYDYSNNNTITDNTASSNNYHGILLTSFSNNNLVSGNNASSNHFQGIIVTYSCNNNTISDNYFIFLHFAMYLVRNIEN
ncbi:CASH domain-dontaining protein [Candidatus Methanophagaceae archaeon]|nr:CASH domain-dontaining protein [Methanophagales archaeon]